MAWELRMQQRPLVGQKAEWVDVFLRINAVSCGATKAKRLL
jgi:hypothetical protein